MRFSCGVQPQYRHLDSGFPDDHRTAWVFPPPSIVEPELVGEDLRLFIRLLQLADEVGFDAIGLNEHHQTAFAMHPSPNLPAAALAITTKRAAIKILGNSLALYNPPIRVAEELAYLDCLSDGRIVAGFVLGIPMDSVFSYGIPAGEVRDRFHEARQLIERAWQEPEPFSFNGRFTQLRYVNVFPRPIQKRIPVWVPGTSSTETWELCSDNDYGYAYLAGGTGTASHETVHRYWDFVAERGGDTNPYRFSFGQMICVAPTDAQAERDYAEAVRYFHTHQKTDPRFFIGSPGYNTARTIREQAAAGRPANDEDRVRAFAGELDFWEYDEKGFIIAGSPERVRQRIRELSTDLRIGHLGTTMHFGNLNEEVARQNIELFGREVIPHLRDLWAGHEDRWSPAVRTLGADDDRALVARMDQAKSR